MNQTQLESLLRVLLAAGGPVAGLLVNWGVAPGNVTNILTVALIVLPPLISGVWGILRNTDKQNVAKVAAMPDQAKATAVAALPEDQQSRLAAALPDKAVVAAAGAMTGVEVKVDETASPAAQAAAVDPSVPGVRPA